MNLQRRGRVWKFGDQIGMQTIAPVKRMKTPEDRARLCLEPADPAFAAEHQPGDFVVAGAAFGYGSGTEHASVWLREAGVGGVIAESLAPQFLRHSLDYGLLVMECPGITRVANAGDILEVDFATGKVMNATTGATITGRAPQGAMRGIIEAGGLLPFVEERLKVRDQ